jgi:DHA2 family multidrug resistance protein
MVGLIYAGLDQGNRLDWLNSGVGTGLLLAGGLLVVAFLMNEARTPYPLIDLRVLVQPNIAVPALLISIYGFGATATSFVLPSCSGTWHGSALLSARSGRSRKLARND